jgi:hypothetical protein
MSSTPRYWMHELAGDPRALYGDSVTGGVADWTCRDCGMRVGYWDRHTCPAEERLREIIREEFRAALGKESHR